MGIREWMQWWERQAAQIAQDRRVADAMATIRADGRIIRTPVTVTDIQRVVDAVNVRTGLILTRWRKRLPFCNSADTMAGTPWPR